uniref:AlNc14C24G2418 protein n=1 Tax=Albugo laibachii Nc14 TaxID=890382 RepID=F0W6B9_9STRA|nr:AlNc14C24G2418 [Albugo laibachii Nc14]|eukprot:CCA16662.1 AlNc14C24G2418 [Albugo laibachii Nc14]
MRRAFVEEDGFLTSVPVRRYRFPFSRILVEDGLGHPALRARSIIIIVGNIPEPDPPESRTAIVIGLATRKDVCIIDLLLSDKYESPAVVEIDDEVSFVDVLDGVLVERTKVQASLQLGDMHGDFLLNESLLLCAELAFACLVPQQNLVALHECLDPP